MSTKSNSLEKSSNFLKKLAKIHGQEIIKVSGKANSAILSNYGDGFVAGTPQKVELLSKSLWITPIVMANSTRLLGEVGVVAVDGESLEILGITEPMDIEKKIRLLTHEETEMV
jgi:hypothetical protein